MVSEGLSQCFVVDYGSMRRNRTLSCWVVALLAFFAVSVPGVALAQDDILLGAFYTSDSDYTDSIYLSYNGTEMKRIATVYESQVGNSYLDGKSETHKGHIDPSIIFHEGKFWMLSGWNRNDGKFWPMISYSSDLVHWTHPEGEAYIDGTHGVPRPAHSGQNAGLHCKGQQADGR